MRPIDSAVSHRRPAPKASIFQLLVDRRMARLLLRSGADPYRRATFRKLLRDMGDSEEEQLHEYRGVTAVDCARIFQKPKWVNRAAIDAILEYRDK
jgi:hypothetical protein